MSIGRFYAGIGALLWCPADGTWPLSTTRWEKRNVAQDVPVWEPDLCIQCGKCVEVCPNRANYAYSVSPVSLELPLLIGFGALQSIPGGHIVRVQVVGNHLRRYPEQVLEVGDALFVSQESLIIIQIADMMAEEGVAVFGQAEGVLEFCPGGQHRWRVPG